MLSDDLFRGHEFGTLIENFVAVLAYDALWHTDTPMYVTIKRMVMSILIFLQTKDILVHYLNLGYKRQKYRLKNREVAKVLVSKGGERH